MSDQSRQLLLILIPITLVLGYVMGVYQETVLLFVFQHIYNDLRGCDTHFLVRNALIAIGYGLYSAISLSILTGPTHCLNKDGYVWVGVVTGVMFCTQHICDIKDAEGDKLRGRKSAPIVLGDLVCRWSVAVPVMVCSWTCPVWFGLGWGSCVATMGMGGLVAGRTLVLRDLDSDKLTWKLWALWTCSLFMLPLVKNPAVLCGLWEGVLELRYIEKGFISGLDVAAVSGIAAVVEGRRMWALMRGGGNETARVPVITVNGVVA
jgi:4-hydroxybenzoate polyprenyltransferase